MAAIKSLPVHRFSVVIFTFSGPLGWWDLQTFGQQSSAQPRAWGMRDVASAIISYEPIK